MALIFCYRFYADHELCWKSDQQIIVPGSTYWNFGVGRNKGEAAAEEEAMRNMKDLGGTIAWLIKMIGKEK